MANADFTKQSGTPGGFTGESYQAEKKAEKPLTPAQKKLSRLENALPGGLKNQAVAAVILTAAIAVSVLGMGGAKLHSAWRTAADSFVSGVAADVKSGSKYTMQAQLEIRAASARSVILAASGFSGVSGETLAGAQSALDAMDAALAEGAGPEALYDADVALEAAINLLHADVKAHAPEANKTGAEHTAFSQFAGAGTTLRHLSYNEAANNYNEAAGGFPASLIGKLWGCGKVEPFA